ncbi:hypothetical protein BCR34DRAFT_581932 [Clohesyomyces aquaticus]|uniref:Mediator of RNA polymerase II transcription subunit 8 n=1 Tax=Clohesyomyces aquaticus TaxID=1231657 RepID=A0A1Y2AB12_9PLEO|nr:hypothetical protein BCR34DRAFT_581932 [Clohesyomyces aquaticus]
MNPNAISNLKAEDISMLETLRARLMPLAYNLQQLQNEIAASPDGTLKWPTIQRQSALLNSHLSTIQKLIADKEKKTVEVLSSLYPYPMPPFPIEQMEGLSSTLTRKKPEPGDENWILERLRKAAEFCDGAEELGLDVVVKKEGDGDKDVNMKDEDEDGDGDDEDDGENGVSGRKGPGAGIKRVKTTLSQEDITYLWENANDWVTGQMAKVVGGEGSDASGSEGSSPASDTGDGEIKKRMEGQPGASAATALAQRTAPAMSLGAVLKFMETGEGS